MNIPDKDFKQMIDTLVLIIIKLKKKGLNVAVLFFLWSHRRKVITAFTTLSEVVEDLQVLSVDELARYTDAFEKHFDLRDEATEAAIEISVGALTYIARAAAAWKEVKQGLKF